MKSLIRFDPFRLMRRGDPFEDLRLMQKEMDHWFGRLLGEGEAIEPAGLWVPAVESFTRDGHLVIKAELPGVDAKDLEVTLTERELVIKGERKAEKEEKKKDYAFREISYGSFERRFSLPEGVKAEEMKAKFTSGILEITVPVPEIATAKRIEIETKEAKQLESEPVVKKAA
jgi:HSP20 family protein